MYIFIYIIKYVYIVADDTTSYTSSLLKENEDKVFLFLVGFKLTFL